jgi:hypothetical protein
MAKNFALLALIIGVASLFLPTAQSLDGTITVSVFTGNGRSLAGALLMAPPTVAALFGATLGRRHFGRSLGALHLVLGVAGVALCLRIFLDRLVQAGMVEAGMGTCAAAAAAVLALIAGLIGLIKPDPGVEPGRTS